MTPGAGITLQLLAHPNVCHILLLPKLGAQPCVASKAHAAMLVRSTSTGRRLSRPHRQAPGSTGVLFSVAYRLLGQPSSR
jgi:hypothetical protein